MSQLQNVAKGALGASILRSSSKIKEERGLAIWKDAERTYKRKVEDLAYKVDKMRDQQNAMLDLSPTNTQSLVLAQDFDPEQFFKVYHELTMQIRTAKIELEEATAAYESLFVNPAATAVAAQPE